MFDAQSTHQRTHSDEFYRKKRMYQTLPLLHNFWCVEIEEEDNIKECMFDTFY